MAQSNEIIKKMIISIPFNTLAYSEDRLTSQWINNRLDIFWKYTLQSLKVQTYQGFQTYLNYDVKSEEIMKEALIRREALPANVHFGEARLNKEAIEDQIAQVEKVYIIRLDSDNLYHKDYFKRLYDYEPKEDTEAIVNQYGYLYGEQSQRLVHYYQFSPPFYTLIYNPKEYIRGKRYELPGGHGSVAKKLKCEFLSGDNYLVSIHGQNVSNGEWLINGKKDIAGEEKEKILHEFGIYI